MTALTWAPAAPRLIIPDWNELKKFGHKLLIDGQFSPGQDIQMIDRGVQTPPATAPVSLEQVGAYNDTTSQTTFTSSALAISTAGLMVIGYSGRNSTGRRSPVSATLDGNTATLYGLSDVARQAGFFCYRFASAGSYVASITFDGAVNKGISMYAWVLSNLSSDVPTSTDGSNANSTTTISATVNIPAGGCMLGAGMHLNVNEHTWSGPAGITKRNDVLLGSPDRATQADLVTASLLTGATPTISWTTSANSSIYCAAWR